MAEVTTQRLPGSFGIAVAYNARRLNGGRPFVTREYADQGRSELPDYADVRRVSAGGYDWGRPGPEAAQLAYALLLDVVGPTFADALYPDFAAAVVRHLHPDGWDLTREEVVAAARRVASGEGGVS